MTDTRTINMIYMARNCKGELTALEYSLPKVPAASRAELDFTGVFAIHGIHQQITRKEGKSIIWSRDKLKARQPQIDPVCAGVCGIQQITWGQQGRRKLLREWGSRQGLPLRTDRKTGEKGCQHGEEDRKSWGTFCSRHPASPATPVRSLGMQGTSAHAQ